MRILVIGSEQFDDMPKMHGIMKDFFGDDPVIMSIGGKGAAYLAEIWAEYHRCQCLSFPADQKEHGWRAVEVRNKMLFNEGKPDVVISFDGGQQTVIDEAKERNIIVVEVK